MNVLVEQLKFSEAPASRCIINESFSGTVSPLLPETVRGRDEHKSGVFLRGPIDPLCSYAFST